MANFVEKLAGFFDRRRAQPFTEQGVGGTAIYGGYVENKETNANLIGSTRWRTAADLLSNISVIAASVRLVLNLAARPKWKMEPASDKAEDAEIAEFFESVLEGCATSWPRIVRRSGMYRFHGFGIQEWIAKRRDDGKIGLLDIEPRPGHTIERWDRDGRGNVLGVVQRDRETGQELYLPRAKIIYLVDDIFSDSPEGMGWFRHLAEPAERLKAYLKLETMGFERDLSGIPVGRAPLSAINRAVKAGSLTKEEGDKLVKGMRDFVTLKARQPNTGMLLDSAPYEGKTGDGTTVTSVMQWGLELLTGEQTSIQQLGEAIRRLNFDMALITGTENILTGREGAGSLALSEDKSRNLYLNVNEMIGDMAGTFGRDVIDPICALNGIPDERKPRLNPEDASFQDAAKIAKVLADMATAGAILAPDDPAIDDIRDLVGVSRQPELTPERIGLLHEVNNPPMPEPDPKEPPKSKP